MVVNYLVASVVSSVASFAGLNWWLQTLVEGIRSDGLFDENGIHPGNARLVFDLLWGSKVSIALLASFTLSIFSSIVLSLKKLFFVQLYPSETRKVLELIINYLIYKGIFLPLIVPPNTFQVVLWSAWLIILCFLKIFQSLARDRLERLNASPITTPFNYFRVFSVLLLVLSADFLWIRVCLMIYRSFKSDFFILLFSEPLCIAFETLQAIMVHGFQLADIWQRHSTENFADGFSSTSSYKASTGSASEWKVLIIRNCGFLLEMMTLLMAMSHYLLIWGLRGMAFHVLDAALFLNLRVLVSASIKRTRGFIRLRKALSSLDGALPDATYEELCAYNDECAICREPMARAKKLSCSHLFHLACLRSWLDQGLTEVYSCPTCRRPLFLSNSQTRTGSIAAHVSNDEPLAEVNNGLDQQIHSSPIRALPHQQQNLSDPVWRGIGLNSSWVPPWPNPEMDGAGTSSGVNSVGLSGVQMMMRQLASVSENYAHNTMDETASWNFWSSQQASASSVAHPTPSVRPNRNTTSLRFRNTTTAPVSGNVSDILSMVDRVHEVMPHIPEELIIQDLLRTNNVNVTVNNLLLMQ